MNPWEDDEEVFGEPRTIASHARRRRGRRLLPGRLAARVSRHTVRIVVATLVPLFVLTIVGLVLLWPRGPEQAAPASVGERAYGDVLRITEQQCVIPDDAGPCGVATIHVTSGAGTGRDEVVALPSGPGAPVLAVGDAVVLIYQPESPQPYAVIDHQRGRPMILLLVLSALAVVGFARLRGLTALAGLAVSFALLLGFIVPAILDGRSPLLVAIVGSAAIMFAVLYLTHGFTVHTSVAVLGTLVSLVITGVLGYLFTAATQLSGFGSEEALYVSLLDTQVDLRGLLLAGIIIGALGVLDDVTVTQASTVAELARTGTSRREIYRSAARVGRAHVASAVNTIVLAYAGAALPLLLLIVAGGRAVTDVLTSQVLAQEIVRAAVGTVGLVAAVPITTALAVLVADLRKPDRPGRPAA